MTARRRIGIVTQGYDGGGVATVVRWLRDGLERTGSYEVDIHDLAASTRDQASQRILAPRSWRRQTLTSSPDGDNGVRHWGARAVEIEVMRYRPRAELTAKLASYDLVQVVAGAPALAMSALAAGVPVALQVATTVSAERWASLSGRRDPASLWRRAMTGLTSRIETTALRGVDLVFVENDIMLEHCRTQGQPAVIKAPPGVDTERFTPDRPTRRQDGHLISVGTFIDPRKGLDRLITAYSTLVRRSHLVPDLIVVGRGAVPGILRRQVAQLGVEPRVQLRPDVDEAELLSLYRGASAFLQTSHEEGLGIAVLEAMACGLPVVATRTAGTSETVRERETGWLLPQTADALQIAEAVEHALGAAGTEAGVMGRIRCERVFSLPVTLAPYLSGYDKLLAGSSRHG